MTNETKPNDDAWQPCDSGAIQHFVRQKKNRRRAVFAAQLAAGAVIGGILALLYTGMPRLPGNGGEMPEYNFGGIACKDVRSQAQAYMKGELDAATAAKIRDHLQECPNCPKLIEKMENERAGHVRPHDFPVSRTASVGLRSHRLLVAHLTE